ncbi:MAG: HEAT repeat domain-containing protein [Cyclobacteriaceae bacterium]|nr:HEAT repeat domain-containing protein [Cyclobacteriaceae bacterium]
MNLLNEIRSEHSRDQMLRIVGYVGSSPKRFADLVKIFLTGPYRVTQRAAWPLSNCVELHPELVYPHLKRIILFLGKTDEHDAVKRNILRLLQFISIPKSLQGKTANLCFQFLGNTKEPIAIRVFAMTVLANLAKVNPELKNEIILIIEDQLPYGSAGFVSRGRKVLKELKR